LRIAYCVRSKYEITKYGIRERINLDNYSINLIRLETGTFQHEALGLYERMGYRQISVFGDYRESAVNVFYEKQVA
jgi:ribosomal protein S18 acetylase RimI-like enzyme